MEIRKLRQSKGLNQSDFWAPLGVTQSGGCRYETDRHIPKPVQILINIAYGNKRTSARALCKLFALGHRE